jgi:hypothetical protein
MRQSTRRVLHGILGVGLLLATEASAAPKRPPAATRQPTTASTVAILCHDFARVAGVLAESRDQGLSQPEAAAVLRDYVRTLLVSDLIQRDYMTLVWGVYAFPKLTPAQHREMADKVCWDIWEPFIQ